MMARTKARRAKRSQPATASPGPLRRTLTIVAPHTRPHRWLMAGGIAALLLQMLHPRALGGVWDHSDVHSDMIGRLRRTARFIATTTYAHRDDALRAIAKVNAIHQQIGGTLASGATYRATDPHLLAWVHVAGAINFLDGWRRYADRLGPLRDALDGLV